MKTITIKAKEKEINKLLDILKELNISYELESNNYKILQLNTRAVKVGKKQNKNYIKL